MKRSIQQYAMVSFGAILVCASLTFFCMKPVNSRPVFGAPPGTATTQNPLLQDWENSGEFTLQPEKPAVVRAMPRSASKPTNRPMVALNVVAEPESPVLPALPTSSTTPAVASSSVVDLPSLDSPVASSVPVVGNVPAPTRPMPLPSLPLSETSPPSGSLVLSPPRVITPDRSSPPVLPMRVESEELKVELVTPAPSSPPALPMRVESGELKVELVTPAPLSPPAVSPSTLPVFPDITPSLLSPPVFMPALPSIDSPPSTESPVPSGLAVRPQALPELSPFVVANSPIPTRLNSPGAYPGAIHDKGAQQAFVTIEKIVPEEVQVNRQETITIVLQNTGKSVARQVVLRDMVPVNSILVSTNPPIKPLENNELVWGPFELTPNEERQISYIIVPQAEGDIGSVARLDFTTEISTRVRSTKPVLMVDVQAPSEVLIGENLTLDISISNVGTGTATGVALTEKIPPGFSHPGGKVLDNRIETIAPNETKKLSLTLTSTAPGRTVNELVVSADNGISLESRTPIVVNSPELLLEIAGEPLRYLDRDALFLLRVSNPGTANAKNVRLTAALPRNVDFAKTNNLGEYDSKSHSVIWELVELPHQLAPGELELVVRPREEGTGTITLKGTGDYGISTEVTQEIRVEGMPALSFEVKSLSDPVEVGKEAVYEVRLINRGTSRSTRINLQVMIPEEMKVVDSQGPTRFTPIPGGIRFLPVESVNAKGDVTYLITAICSKPGDHRIKVQVSSDDMEALIKEESVRVYR